MDENSGILVSIPCFEAVFNAYGECIIQWEDGAIKGTSFDTKDQKIKLTTLTGLVSHLLHREGTTALNSMS